MKNNVNTANLIIPVYINEKIVLDMLAIMEDGFSMVSQINYISSIFVQNQKRPKA